MNNYVVRVVLPDGVHELSAQVRTLLHCLGHGGPMVIHRDDEDGMCFDIVPPAGVTDTKAWADEMAAALESFHYNAVRAPACPMEPVEPPKRKSDEEWWADLNATFQRLNEARRQRELTPEPVMLSCFTPSDVLLLQGSFDMTTRLLEAADAYVPVDASEESSLRDIDENLNIARSKIADVIAVLTGKRP
jgi:hypothetical protein